MATSFGLSLFLAAGEMQMNYLFYWSIMHVNDDNKQAISSTGCRDPRLRGKSDDRTDAEGDTGLLTSFTTCHFHAE